MIFSPQLSAYWSSMNQLVRVYRRRETCGDPPWQGNSFPKMPVTEQTWTPPLHPPQTDAMTHSLLTDHVLYSLRSVAHWMSVKLLFVTKHAFAVTDAPNSFSPLSSRNHSCVVPQVQCCQIFALFNYSSWFYHRIKLPGGIMGFQHEQRTWPYRCQPLPSVYRDSISHTRW